MAEEAIPQHKRLAMGLPVNQDPGPRRPTTKEPPARKGSGIIKNEKAPKKK